MIVISKKILVLGAKGLLGSEFLNNDYLPGWEVIRHSRSEEMQAQADISSLEETTQMLDALNPDVILNFVGLTDVELCESFPNEAYVCNVKTLENVVLWIKSAKKNIQLIHISTDQVYDGLGPHLEDQVSLKNYYAFSKYTSELVASSAGALIIRTNFFGKSKNEDRVSLTDWLFLNLKEKRFIQVFDDVMFSPLFMPTLCAMLSLAIEKKIIGVYNLGSRDGLSKADFAYKFATVLGFNCHNMERCSIDKSGLLRAYRPKDMRLDVQRFENAVGVNLPTLDDEIKKAAEEYLK